MGCDPCGVGLGGGDALHAIKAVLVVDFVEFYHFFSIFCCNNQNVCIFAGGVYARLVKQTSVQAEPGGGDKGVQYFDTVNTVSHKLTASYLSPIVCG